MGTYNENKHSGNPLEDQIDLTLLSPSNTLYSVHLAWVKNEKEAGHVIAHI